MKIKEISKRIRSGLLLAALGVCCLVGVAQVPSAPSPVRLVNDRAGLFSPVQTRVLEDSLAAFDRATSIQMVVVTLADLGNYTPSQMAFAIMDQWGVGQKDKQNGIVVLIKPRNAQGRGEVFIATGLGLEGVLPDAKATRVVDRQMMPYLKAGDYFGAVEVGCSALRAITRGEYTADGGDAGELVAFGVAIFVLVLIVVGVVAADKRSRKGGGSGGSSDGGGGDALTWLILGSLLGGGRGPRSGGGFGGGDGGGFGGFGGGGSFGGGGGRSF